jgi:hypothetical protein
MNPYQPLVLPREAPEPTHECIRCGREGVPIDKALCDDCNPLELAQPSATQVHGIAAAGIIAFVVVLAVLARFTMAGTGPFSGAVEGVAAVGGGLTVTLVVANQGTKDAATSCIVSEAGQLGAGRSQLIQTPVIPAGSQLRFTATVTKLGASQLDVAVTCQSP